MFTIIPTKPFSQAKTRLAPLLSLEQRMQLSRYLLLRTINIANQVGQVVVISRDATVRRLAKSTGAWALIEAEASLNSALQQASEWVLLRDEASVLILPGDLPLLTVTDLQELISLDTITPSMVIAPCHRQEGTNALLLRPLGTIPFAFGPNSFTQHQRLAQAQGLNTTIYDMPNLALDLDLPDDFIRFKSSIEKNGGQTCEVLKTS